MDNKSPIDGAIYIALNLLAPSPTNPRKTFDQARLQEMADSLKAHGQISPIVVRPHPAGTPEQLAEAGRPLYEIVAGERRWRGAKLAELPSLMALVRQMTDFEVLQVQLIENLEREDLEPLEEAEGYRKLLSTSGNQLAGFANVDELAARIGKSRRYVYNRLKLCDLCTQGREALAAGKISTSVAQIVAGLPTDEQQAAAVERILIGFGGEPFTYRAALEFITREFMLRLDRAPFDIVATYAAAGPCGQCPKRSGAHGDLFADVQGGDMCQDAKCFNAKGEEAHQLKLQAAREAGLEILAGDRARAIVPNGQGPAAPGHRRLDEPCPELTLNPHPLGELLGPKFKPVLVLDHPTAKTVIRVAPEFAVRKALKAKGLLRAGLAHDEKDAAGRHGAAAAADDRAEDTPPAKATAAPAPAPAAARPMTSAQRENAATERRGALFGPLLFTALHKALQARSELPGEALEMMVMQQAEGLSVEATRLVYGAWGWPMNSLVVPGLDDMRKRVAKLDGRRMGELLIELTLLAEDLSDGRPLAELHYSPAPDLAEALGVDVKAIDRQAEHQAREQILAEQAEQQRAAIKGKRDKMLPPAKPGTSAVKYRDPATGSTWSGRGLQPAWLKVALASGRKLEEFAAAAAASKATAAFVAGATS